LRRAPRPAQNRTGRLERPDDTNELRINRRIRVPRVLVIDEEGNKLGEFMTEDAIRLAEERGLDLVEVAPTARPPVCRITDFGKLKYDKKKREQEARRNQVQVVLKEIKLRPKTEEHDLGVKTRAARHFLDEGNKVKITVRFRGRELAHRDIGAQQCQAMAEALTDVAIVETPPRMDGRQMFMMLAPTKKPSAKPRPSARKEEDAELAAEIARVDAAEPDDDDDDDDDEDDEAVDGADA
jgi:translation initiation factor IF-3